jgi:hypothetical protein
VKSFVCDVQMVASYIYFELVDCNRSYARTIASHAFFVVFVECNCSHIRIISSHICFKFVD